MTAQLLHHLFHDQWSVSISLAWVVMLYFRERSTEKHKRQDSKGQQQTLEI